MSIKAFIVKNLLRIKPGTDVATEAGEIRVDSADGNKLKVHDGSSEKTVVVSSTTLTASRALQSDASSNLESSAVTTTELGYLSGVTSAIQTQLDGKVDEVASTDNAVVRFDGATGSVQDSGVLVDDSNNVSGAADVSASTFTVNNQIVATTDNTIDIGASTERFATTYTVNIDSGADPLNINSGGQQQINFHGNLNLVDSATSVAFGAATNVDLATDPTDSTIDIGTGVGNNTINIGGANSTINLTGTVNNQNVTNLNVTDKLITINDGGAAGSGGNAGIEIEENNVATGYIYTAADRNSWSFKAPNTNGVATLTPGATNDDVVMRQATQTLTNKTLTSPTINGGTWDGGTASNTNKLVLPAETTSNLDSLTDDQGFIAYDTTRNKPVYNDGTNWRVLGSGSGVGGISYFSGIDLGTDTTNISAYDDTGAYVDGTGGNPAIISIYRDISDTLVTDADLRINKATGSGTGEGVTLLSDTIEPVDRGRKLWIRFEWNGTDADYVSNDMKLYAYDVTNESTIPVIPVSGCTLDTTNNVPQLPNLRTQVLAYVVPPSTCTQVRVSLHLLTDNASGVNYDVYVARPRLSPEASVPGAIITPWQSYTPTLNSETGVSSKAAYYRRVGDTLEAHVYVAYSGTGAATKFTASIPSGLTIATAKLPGGTGDANSGGAALGDFFWKDTGTNYRIGSVIYDSTTAVGAIIDSATTTQLSNATAADDNYVLKFSVPIAEWSASAALSTTEIGLQTVQVLASKNSGTHTSTGNYQDVAWTEGYDNFSSFDGTTFTAPKAGNYCVIAAIVFATNTTNVRAAQIHLNGTAVTTGPVVQGLTSSSCSVAATLRLAKGDLVKIMAYQNSGGNLNYDSSATPVMRLSITEVPDFTVFSTLFDNSDVELYLDTPGTTTAGYGTTNTRVRRYTQTRKQTGSGVYYTYTDSAANGMSVTIRVPGTYAFQVADASTAAATALGLTVNDSVVTTDIGSTTYAQGKRTVVNTPAANLLGHAACTLRLNSGDVVRMKTNITNQPNSTSDNSFFQMIRVGN